MQLQGQMSTAGEGSEVGAALVAVGASGGSIVDVTLASTEDEFKSETSSARLATAGALMSDRGAEESLTSGTTSREPSVSSRQRPVLQTLPCNLACVTAQAAPAT